MCPAAARISDPIAHTSIMGDLAKMAGSLVVGALIGAALTVAAVAVVTAVVATGGLALGPMLAIGFAVGVAMEASGLNEFIDHSVSSAVNAFIPPVDEGEIAHGSSNVFINSLAAARAASPDDMDNITCKKHPSMPLPMLAQGSANVFINDHPAARVDDKTTCGGTISGGSKNVFIGGGTVTVRDIQDERPWWITALGVAIGIAMILCGRGKLSMSSLKSLLPCFLELGAGVLGGLVGHQLRTAAGHPVNVITGGKILHGETDFNLPGPLSLNWTRFYSSHDDRRDSLLGPGWSLPLSVELNIERNSAGEPTQISYVDEQGRGIDFPPVEAGESHFSVAEGIYLICTEGGRYVVETLDGLYREFGSTESRSSDMLKLHRLEDRNGNWIAFSYGDNGWLQEIRDSCGRKLDVLYTPGMAHRISAVRLAIGCEGEASRILVQYRYTAQGELAEVIDRSGNIVRSFAYQHSLITRHTLPSGLPCYYQWQGQGKDARVIRHWTDDGESYDFTYNLEQRRTVVTDQVGRVQRWEWNADCQPTTYTDALGQDWRYVWDDNRQLLEAIDPTGAATRFAYDKYGRLIERTNALGQIEKTEWHPVLDLPFIDTDAAGNERTYEYDERGNLSADTDPAGFVTEYHYDRRGLVHTIRDAKGGYKHLSWNKRGQLITYTDCSNKTTRFDYDACATLTRITDALGNETRYQTDAMGRVTDVYQADGSRQQFRYDLAGRLIANDDGKGQVTQYRRNRRGQVVERIDALGNSMTFEYDRAQRLSTLVNENKDAYHFQYDAANRLIAEVALDGTRHTYTRNALGLPIQVKEAAGTTDEIALTLERNVLGQLIRKITPETVTTYESDALGLVTQIVRTDPKGAPIDKIAFEYDGRRQIVSESTKQRYIKYDPNLIGHIISESTEQGRFEYAYDELGNRIQTILPDGRKIDQLHYGSGHVHQINIDQEILCDFERDDLHREIMRTQGQVRTRTSYDPLGRISRMWCHRPVDAREWDAREGWQRFERPSTGDVILKGFEYDHTGELTRRRDNLQGEVRYNYDQVGRIASTQGTALHEVFEYDRAANLIANAHDKSARVVFNRIEVYEDKRFSYDAHGRLSEKKSGKHTVQTFRYDSEHHLIKVRSTRNNQTQDVHFEYDALGRRTAKRDHFGITHYRWDGMRMVQEARGSKITTYVYEPNSYVPLARVDSAVKTPGFERPAQVYYFHTDAAGAAEDLTDHKGRTVWQGRYQTWGNLALEELHFDFKQADGEFDPLRQNLRFQGQMHDRETGLHYNTFRYYDPDIGRFITPDPIGLAGGTNLHQYAPNPISWIDPLGWAGLDGLDASGRPLSSPNYSVWQQVELPDNQLSLGRSDHFKYANEQLNNAIQQNPELGNALGTNVVDHVAPGARGAYSGESPPNLSWHHNEQNPRLLELVPRPQHRAPGPVQQSLHPKQGGGFKKLQAGCR